LFDKLKYYIIKKTMPEELPEGMREGGAHLHHEVEPVMPEMVGKEKGVRFKREATKRTVMTALGAKRVSEIGPAIEKLESKPLQEILRSQRATTEEFIKTPRGRDSLLKRNELLINLVASGGLNEEEEEVANKLINSIGRLIEKTREPEKPPEAAERLTEAAERMAGAAETQARVSMGVLALELPLEKEHQRAVVREYLDRIEKSNRDCHDFSISTIVQRLEASLDDMDPEIAKETKARLAIHDCSELIKQANGWIERKVEEVGPGHTIGSAITEAKRRNHELSREMISLFLKEGIPGLRVAEAWNLLQEANFNYEEKVEEINRRRRARGEKELSNEGLVRTQEEIEKGEYPVRFYTDTDAPRKNAVHEYMIEKLGEDEAAKKSIQLAEKLAIATLETSVFNRAGEFGNDQLGEIIHLREYRRGRRKTGRVRGPRIHEGAIPGFGTSWLRERSQKKLARKIEEGQRIVDIPLMADDVLVEEIGEGGHSYFGTVIVTRYYLLRGLLLDRRPKPMSIDKTLLQTAVVYFNTADKPKTGEKTGELRLRVWWLAGVADIALAKEDLEWDADALNELRKAAVLEELSPEAGTFITENQWEWIDKATNFKRRAAGLAVRRAVKGVVKKATS